MNLIKIITIVLIAGQVPLIAFAQSRGSKPKVVIAEGLADINLANATDAAKSAAAADAEQKCGSAPVLLADNLGWQVSDTDLQPPCRPHQFCGGIPTRVAAVGTFVCLANLSIP